VFMEGDQAYRTYCNAPTGLLALGSATSRLSLLVILLTFLV